MQRIGMEIGIRPEKIEEYKKLHAAVWPEVLAILRKHHISNYSIFLKGERMFSYFEYDGDDIAADMKNMGKEPKMQEWYALCSPCQVPLETRKPGEWWASMEQVFFME
ncbi:MAG: L-rhamnose mutarotase [Hyphomonadaceae bacterium]|nr:L-rhamnose mutarotase [Hyphomonadaceae bacterium]